MGKNKKRGATNKDALVATGKKEKNALFANCSAWMAKAKDKGAKDHAAMQHQMKVAMRVRAIMSSVVNYKSVTLRAAVTR